MSSQVCPICGKTTAECKEWRPCPKLDKQLICGSEHCILCEYWRKPEDIGTLWCTYHHGRSEGQKVNIVALNNQIRDKEKEIKDLYDANKPKKAELSIWQLVDLQTKLRRAEDEIHTK